MISDLDYQRGYREEYLNSARWRETASAAVARAGACGKCGSPDDLDAHHRTYRNIGRERPGDIVVLCRWCHELVERLKTVFPSEETTDRFMNIPELRVTLPVTGFSDERGLGDRGNFWYQNLAQGWAGSVNITLNKTVNFSAMREKFPVGEVGIRIFRKSCWIAPFARGVPLSVRIFARDANPGREGDYRGVTDDGIEVHIKPQDGSRPFPGAHLLPECTREQGKVLAEVIYQLSRRHVQPMLF